MERFPGEDTAFLEEIADVAKSVSYFMICAYHNQLQKALNEMEA